MLSWVGPFLWVVTLCSVVLTPSCEPHTAFLHLPHPQVPALKNSRDTTYIAFCGNGAPWSCARGENAHPQLECQVLEGISASRSATPCCLSAPGTKPCKLKKHSREFLSLLCISVLLWVIIWTLPFQILLHNPFVCLFISFHKYSSTYYVPGTVLGAWAVLIIIIVIKGTNLCLHRVYNLAG